MKSLHFLFVITFFPALLFAQSNYKAGYVVKANGDTVKGYINYKEWKITPKFIDFKSEASDKEPTRFFPGRLKSFEVSNMDKYITYTGQVSMDKNVVPNLPVALDTTTVQDTLFLEIIYGGKPVSMLKQQDAEKIRYFVMDKAANPVELLYHQYFVEGNNLSESTPYKSLLRKLAAKYKGGDINIHKAVNTTNFREAELYKLIKKINDDHTHTETGTYGSRFFAAVLFNRTISSFNGINFTPLENPAGENSFADSKPASYIPQISAGLDIFANKYTQKAFVRLELAFGGVKSDFVGANSSFGFKQYTIALIPQFIYNFYNKDKLKVFAGAGVGINYSNYSNKAGTWFSQSLDYELKHLWLNFPLQTGVTFHKKVDVFAMYIPSGTYTNYTGFSISNKTYGLGIRYLFNN